MKSSKKKKGRSTVKTTNNYKYSGKLSLVIPCYNETDRISLLEKAMQRFDKRWQLPYELIIVDDGSADESVDLLRNTFPGNLTNLAEFKLIELGKNQGKGSALKKGVEAATGDHILTLDIDMAAHPNELLKWLNLLDNHTFPGDTILIGSREHKDSKVSGLPSRKVIGNIFNFIIQMLTALQLKDTQCGFKLYPAEIAKKLFASLRVGGWAHDVELLSKAQLEGVKIESLPITWDHVEGTKIKVMRDSIRMFLQTLSISLSNKLDWFILKPLKNTPALLGQHKEPPIFRFLFILLFGVLLVLMPALSSDYGISGDEYVQRVYGDKLLKYYKSDGELDSYLDWKNLKYYGGLFDYIAARLNPADDPLPPDPEKANLEEEAFRAPIRSRGDVYEFRHFLNAVFGVFMILFAGLVARLISGSWMVAFLTMLLAVLSPRLFGHSMNNPKDVPFAAAFLFGFLHIVYFVKQLPRPGIRSIIWMIVGIALAINIRVGGVLLIAYLGLFTGVAFLWRSDLRKKILHIPTIGSVFFIGCLIAFFSLIGGTLFWPYARQNPIAHIPEALGEMSNFSIGIRILFRGEHIWSDKVPWDYLPTWFMISAPLVVIIGLFLALVVFVLQRKKIKGMSLFMVAFAGLFPVIFAIVNKSSLYDGLRHFLFAYVFIVILAAWSWKTLMDIMPSKFTRIGVAVVLALLMALPLQWMVRNHPYQYIYFNELLGGTDKAFTQYETDYWMNSIKGTSDWIVENIPEAQMAVEAFEQGKTYEEVEDDFPRVVIATNCVDPLNHYLRKQYPNLRLTYVRYNERHRKKWDYAVFFSRFINSKYLNNGTWPPAEVIYEEKMGNVTLSAVTKRESLNDYNGAEALKAKDFAKAIEEFEKAVALNPKNEAAWFGLANSYMQSGQLDAAKRAIDENLKLSDEDVSLLGLLGSWYLQKGEIAQAKMSFLKAVDLNYKYSSAYYYLASIALEEKDERQALKYVELHDLNSGRIPLVFDWGIQLCEKAGLEARANYYKAKKAFFAKSYQESFQFVSRSLDLDPDYQPAIDLMDVFEASQQ